MERDGSPDAQCAVCAGSRSSGTNFENGAISNFVLDNFRNGVKSTRVPERAGRPHLPRRSGLPGRQDRAEQAVAEPLAARRRRVGRERRRPHGGALLVRDRLRLPERGVPATSPRQAAPFGNRVDAERQPAVRGSVSRRPRRRHASAVAESCRRRAVPRLRRRIGAIDPGHQLDARPVVERHASSGSSARRGRCRPATWAATPIACGARSTSTRASSWDSARARSHGVSLSVVHDDRRTSISGARCLCENPARRAVARSDRRATPTSARRTYRGLKLSFRRRADSGVSLSGNYTLSHCVTDTRGERQLQPVRDGYLKPDEPVVRPRQLPAEPAPHRQRHASAYADAASSATRRCARWRRTGASRASSTRARAAG